MAAGTEENLVVVETKEGESDSVTVEGLCTVELQAEEPHSRTVVVVNWGTEVGIVSIIVDPDSETVSVFEIVVVKPD